jgi:hypothetical protein
MLKSYSATPDDTFVHVNSEVASESTVPESRVQNDQVRINEQADNCNK